MPRFVTVAIPEIAGISNSRIIGAALFDLSIDGSSEPNFSNFVGLISGFHPNDMNYDHKISFREWALSTFLPDNYSGTAFAYQSFKYLAQRTLDPRFDADANKALVGMMKDLTIEGLEHAYGVEPGIIGTLGNSVQSNLIKQIAELVTDSFVPQLLIRAGMELLVGELSGLSEPDPPSTRTITATYLTSSSTVSTDDQSQIIIGTSKKITISATTGSGDDLLIGGAGNDTLWGGAGSNALYGGDGNDIVTDRGAGSTLSGGAGYDILRLDRQNETANVEILFKPGTNYVNTLPDGSTFKGFDGLDELYTGSGNDRLVIDGLDEQAIPLLWSGGAGVDHASLDFSDCTTNLRLGSGGFSGGSDFGNFNGRQMHVSAFDSSITFTQLWNVETLRIIGGSGNDDFANHEASIINAEGGAGNDTLWGGADKDRLSGGNGRDSISAGDGNDVVFGGRGDDHIYAGSGRDTIDGGTGSDVIFGGGGGDVFSFHPGFDGSFIHDFSTADMLDFRGMALELSDITIEHGTSRTRITISTTSDTLVLEGPWRNHLNLLDYMLI